MANKQFSNLGTLSLNIIMNVFKTFPNRIEVVTLETIFLMTNLHDLNPLDILGPFHEPLLKKKKK